MTSPRSVLERPSTGFTAGEGLTCVVVGGGLAGVLSAHAACQHFDKVYMLDADSLDGRGYIRQQDLIHGADNIVEMSKHRRGIPQMTRPHALSMGGLVAMEALLPGFRDELVRRGGVEFDLARDVRFFDFGAPFARAQDSNWRVVGASRALLQSTLHDEVVKRNSDKLRLMGNCRVSGLLWNEDKTVVTGVELYNGDKLSADLVITACGRASCLPQWLKAAGHPVPSVAKVDAKLTYVGRMYRIPEDWDETKWLGTICFGRPHSLWGGVMIPVEGRIWQLVQWGFNGAVPPMDEEGFLENARTALPDDAIYEGIKGAEPLTPIEKFGGVPNILRGWDATPPPSGVIAIGDCVQALNPSYGQGMSVSAQSVRALEKSMAAAIPAGGKASVEARRAAARGMGAAFQKKLAGVIAPAWMLATSNDAGYPDTKIEGISPPPAFMKAYSAALMKACHYDVKVMNILFGVAHLMRSPAAIFHPYLLLAAAKQMLREGWAALWPAPMPAAPSKTD